MGGRRRECFANAETDFWSCFNVLFIIFGLISFSFSFFFLDLCAFHFHAHPVLDLLRPLARDLFCMYVSFSALQLLTITKHRILLGFGSFVQFMY